MFESVDGDIIGVHRLRSPERSAITFASIARFMCQAGEALFIGYVLVRPRSGTGFRPSLPWLPNGAFRGMGLLFPFFLVGFLEAVATENPEGLPMAVSFGHRDNARQREVLLLHQREKTHF